MKKHNLFCSWAREKCSKKDKIWERDTFSKSHNLNSFSNCFPNKKFVGEIEGRRRGDGGAEDRREITLQKVVLLRKQFSLKKIQNGKSIHLPFSKRKGFGRKTPFYLNFCPVLDENEFSKVHLYFVSIKEMGKKKFYSDNMIIMRTRDKFCSFFLIVWLFLENFLGWRRG